MTSWRPLVVVLSFVLFVIGAAVVIAANPVTLDTIATGLAFVAGAGAALALAHFGPLP